MDGVEITRCPFQSVNPPVTLPFYDLAAGNQAEPPYQLTFGYLQVAILPNPGSSAAGPAPPHTIAAESPGLRAAAGEAAATDTGVRNARKDIDRTSTTLSDHIINSLCNSANMLPAIPLTLLL